MLDDTSNPRTKPPWGLLTAIDLNYRKRLWKVPSGEMQTGRSDGSPLRGLQNVGGVTATAGEDIAASGTTDNKVRAFDASNGRELWS